MKCRGFIIYSATCLLFLMISCAEDKTAPRNTSSSVSLLEDTDTIFDTSSSNLQKACDSVYILNYLKLDETEP